jgi:hypothetical protein
LEPDDPAYPWRAGIILERVSRHHEAALHFLDAARLFLAAQTSEMALTGDEEDWAETSLYHAARNFALAGSRLAAGLLARRLGDTARAEVLALVSPPTAS